MVLSQPGVNCLYKCPPLFERYDVKAVINNGQEGSGDTYQTFRALLVQHRIPTVKATAGYSLSSDDGVMLDVLTPAQTPETDDKPGHWGSMSVAGRVDFNNVHIRRSAGLLFQYRTSRLNSVAIYWTNGDAMTFKKGSGVIPASRGRTLTRSSG